MKFKLTTVVDITETNARRGGDKREVNQQANFHTIVQTIGLRVNINPISCTSQTSNIDKFGFGSNTKGKQRYWEFTFEVEYEDALTVEMMVLDFDLIPIITELDETAKINNNVFRTNHPVDTNIVFKIIE